MPMLMPMTPTRVRSPRRPETVYFAPCMKSMPASILIEPGGMMSTSSVISGRCCAWVMVAKLSSNNATKTNRAGEFMRWDSTAAVHEASITSEVFRRETSPALERTVKGARFGKAEQISHLADRHARLTQVTDRELASQLV